MLLIGSLLDDDEVGAGQGRGRVGVERVHFDGDRSTQWAGPPGVSPRLDQEAQVARRVDDRPDDQEGQQGQREPPEVARPPRRSGLAARPRRTEQPPDPPEQHIPGGEDGQPRIAAQGRQAPQGPRLYRGGPTPARDRRVEPPDDPGQEHHGVDEGGQLRLADVDPAEHPADRQPGIPPQLGAPRCRASGRTPRPPKAQIVSQ